MFYLLKPNAKAVSLVPTGSGLDKHDTRPERERERVSVGSETKAYCEFFCVIIIILIIMVIIISLCFVVSFCFPLSRQLSSSTFQPKDVFLLFPASRLPSF